MTRKSYVYLSILLLLITTAVVIIYQVTRQGIGVTPDSIFYLCAADNLLKGNGLVTISGKADFIPMTHFPPLYPLLIALGQFIGVKQLVFCKYLNIVVFMLNVILCGFIIYRSTDKNIEAAFWGSILIISSYDVFRTHICAITDPIFLLLYLGTLWTLVLYIDKEHSLYLASCSILAALAFLLRYAGLSLIVAVLAGIWILSKRGLVKKISDGVIFLAISTIPMVVWISRNIYLTGNPFNRTFGYHMLSAANFPEKVGHILQRISSLPFKASVAIIIASILATLVIAYFLNPYRKLIHDKLINLGTAPYLIIDIMIAYIAIVVISLIFFDHAIYLGFRILLPLIVFGQLLMIILLTRLISKKHLIIILVILTAAQLSRWDFEKIRNEELVFSSPQWTASAIIKKVETLPADNRIYSNGHDIIYYMTGKLAYSVPEEMFSNKNVKNWQLAAEINDMALQFARGKSVLVWFDDLTWRSYLISKQSLLSSLELTLFFQAPDGSIYTTKKILRN